MAGVYSENLLTFSWDQAKFIRFRTRYEFCLVSRICVIIFTVLSSGVILVMHLKLDQKPACWTQLGKKSFKPGQQNWISLCLFARGILYFENFNLCWPKDWNDMNKYWLLWAGMVFVYQRYSLVWWEYIEPFLFDKRYRAFILSGNQ